MSNKVVEACKVFQAQLESDIAAGKKWQYRNPSKYLNEQWKKALKKNKRACNCALLARWALKEAGAIPQNTGIFYGNAGKVQWSTITKNTVKKGCDIITIGGTKTVSQLISNKTLKAGDVVMYQDLRHTNIYAGNHKWYDAGHAYCSGSGEGAIFKSWYGNEVYANYKVSHIIRAKNADIPDPEQPAATTTEKKEYIVQAGSFTTKKAAKAHAKEIKAKKFDAIVKKGSDKQYKVQCGKFSSKANAKVLKESLEDAGFDAVVKTA